MHRTASAEVRAGTSNDVTAALALLRACRLPLGGFPDELESFFVASAADHVLGVAALEVRDDCGLLRSLAVAPDARGRGLARRLCAEVEHRAATLGVYLFLLTETAERFFRRRGYEAVDRRGAPEPIRSTREFAAHCPASAVLMQLRQ